MHHRDHTTSTLLDPNDGDGILAGLGDLQRHLQVLGSDLVAADRLLADWTGRSRDHFRRDLMAELAKLADLQDDLRGLVRPIQELMSASEPART